MKDTRPQGTQALDAMANQARVALACAFTSSDDFESRLIALRRARGAYRHGLSAADLLGICAGLVVLAALIVWA